MLSLDLDSSTWGSLASSLALVLTLALSIRFWLLRPHPIPLAYAISAAGWLIYLWGSEAGRVFNNPSLVLFLHHAGWQIAVVTLSFLFLISSGVKRFEIHAIWMVQGCAGLLLLAWKASSSGFDAAAGSSWLTLNLVCSGLVGLHGVRSWFSSLSHVNRLALAASVTGLAICAADLFAFERGQEGHKLAGHVFSVAWLLFWIVMRLCKNYFLGQKGSPDEPPSTSWAAVTGFGVFTEVEEAIAIERRRMAQELHDGVCSQLVNIIVMLNASRLQKALDSLGICMHWVVDIDGPLHQLHGDRVVQVLRIAQECLANVMRHSGASMVKVVCTYLPDKQMMMLEVRDNGQGMPSRDAGCLGGKGLENMRQRARSLGGELQIQTKLQEGTRVRLLVPFAAGASKRKKNRLDSLESSAS